MNFPHPNHILNIFIISFQKFWNKTNNNKSQSCGFNHAFILFKEKTILLAKYFREKDMIWKHLHKWCHSEKVHTWHLHLVTSFMEDPETCKKRVFCTPPPNWCRRLFSWRKVCVCVWERERERERERGKRPFFCKATKLR